MSRLGTRMLAGSTRTVPVVLASVTFQAGPLTIGATASVTIAAASSGAGGIQLVVAATAAAVVAGATREASAGPVAVTALARATIAAATVTPAGGAATPSWTLDILSLDGITELVDKARFRSARLTWALDGSGAAEIDLMPSDVAGGDWLYGRRRVRFNTPGGVPKFQGWLDRLERAGPPGAVKYRASARGLAAILDQRAVHGDFSRVQVPATTIASDLIAHMVAQTDDKAGFTTGTVVGVAPARDRYYCDGDEIGASIRELAELTNGFAWEIDELGRFNAWVGGRGTDLSATITIGEDDVQDWSFVGDMTEFATYATGVGSDPDGPCGPPVLVDFSALRTTYGRREAVVDVDTTSEAELLEATTEELRARASAGQNLKTAWIEGLGPWSFGAVWLGDLVTAELGAAFGGNAPMRLITVNVTLEPGKHEFVECEWEAA